MKPRATIRGYASVYNREFWPAWPNGVRAGLLIQPGAFALAASTPLCFDHDTRWSFANTATDDFQIWADNYGLAFEVSCTTPALDRLARDVAGGMNGVSATYSSGRTTKMETRAGKSVEIVSRTGIDEISVLHNGACPDARCWLSIDGVDRAPYELGTLAARWSLGRQQRTLAQHRAHVPASRGPAVPQSVARLLSSPAFASARTAYREAARHIEACSQASASKVRSGAVQRFSPQTGQSASGVVRP